MSMIAACRALPKDDYFLYVGAPAVEAVRAGINRACKNSQHVRRRIGIGGRQFLRFLCARL